MANRRVRAVVHGRVQGVFFRDYTRREAERLGLSGWVRNEPDGTVSAEFEGPAEAVEEMLGWLRVGSPSARVDRVEIEELACQGATAGFTIRY